MQEKTVLITGGAGYIGSHIAFALASQGYTVIILDNNYPDFPLDPFPWAITIKGDYGNADLLKILFAEYSIDIVIHCAAFSTLNNDTILSIENNNLLTFYEHDIKKTITLLTLMIDHQIKKIIFSSSSDIYSPLADNLINEQQPKEPATIRGKTKLLIETIIQDVHNAYDLNYIILRYFNVSGAYPEHRLGTIKHPDLISYLLESVYQRKPLHFFFEQDMPQTTTAKKIIRDFVHVRDVADANFKACLHLGNELPSDIFNIGSGLSYSIAHIIEIIQQITDIKIDTRDQQALLFNDLPLTADIHRARDILKWDPIYSSLHFIIASLYQLHKNSPHFL